MEILSLGFPYSIAGVGLGVVVGGWITGVFFGFVAAILVFLALWFEILRLDPLLEGLGRFLHWLVPDSLAFYRENIRASFPIQVAAETTGSNSQRIYLWHPHGLFSVSHVFHLGSTVTDFPAALRPISPVGISYLSHIPGFNQLYRIWNIVPSTAAAMRAALGRGESLSVALGGAREALYSQPGRLKLNIKEKKGVFRMALEYGADLVPVITYGENELYEQSTMWIVRMFNKILHRVGIVWPVPTVRCIQKWWGLLAAPLTPTIQTVVGAPVRVEKRESKEISEKMVEDLRETYFTALRRLYSETRPASYAQQIEIV